MSAIGNDARDIAKFSVEVSPPRRRNSKKEEVAEAAKDIIVAEGRSLPRSELYKKLIEKGLVIEGSDPEMVLSTMLWRMSGVIVRVRGGGYWVAGQPSPDGSYDPDKDSPTAVTTANTPSEELEPLDEEPRSIFHGRL